MSDARVQAAIANWGPRLIANGVDYNDFVRVTRGLERWEDWLDAWYQTAEAHRAQAVQARARGHARSAGEAFARAAVCFHFAKFVWVLEPERNRTATAAAVGALSDAHALLDPTAERIEAPLDDATVVANLRRPTIAGPPVALVVLIPGLDSTKEEFFIWESVFLARGMATLSLDGPGQGETGFHLNIRPDYEVAVAAILDAVADRPELDLHRVGAVGVSLGGYYVVRAAAFEPRLRAIAGVSGPFNAAAQWDVMPGLTREAFIHHTGASSPREGRERASALDLDGVAEQVSQPCLVVTGRQDRVIPWEQTKRIADAVPRSEWVLYDEGTHVCNNIPVPPPGRGLGTGRPAVIGAPLRRREDARVLRGQTHYVDDIERPGLLHAAFVRSPHAHAAITAVRAPEDVLTADSLSVSPIPIGGPPGVTVADAAHPILAGNEVRYVGQPVAAVIAPTRALAEDGAERVEVDYEPRPAIVDPRASDRELVRFERSGGDVEAAFARADHVVRGRYALPRLAAVPIEPRGAIAEHDPGRDLLTVWCSAQDSHRPLSQLSRVLGRPEESIRIIVPDVGGAFGSKGVMAPEVAVVAAAAIATGRPVKWVEDRLENFLAAYQGRGLSAEVQLALDSEGTMLGLRAALTADLGAYLLTSTPIPPHTAAMLMTGVYDIPAASVAVRGMATHKVPTGPYRGAGRPEAAYFVERIVDDAARVIGLDRVALRRRNLIRSFPHHTPLGFSYDSGDYERCLDTALELAPSPPVRPGFARGSGVGMYVERAAGQWESADVTVQPTGRVLVRSSASPHGQGHDITFAAIASDRLGVAIDDVVMRFGDSSEVPRGVGTFGSRSVAVAGSAVALACDEVVAIASRVAARLLGVEDITFADGRFAAGGKSLSWPEVAGCADVSLRSVRRFSSDLVFSSGAYAAVVDIERATGHLDVLAIVAVDDAGTIINPLLAHGQVLGGTVQGLGECLIEAVIHDDSGQVRSASLMDYSLLTAAEIPPIAIGEVASPSPRNPLGAKGVGEGGAIGTLAAVSNAVVDALGGHHVDPPFLEEVLWPMVNR